MQLLCNFFSWTNLEQVEKSPEAVGDRQDQSTAVTCLDFDQVCDRPDYCTGDGDMIVDPTDCTAYYTC